MKKILISSLALATLVMLSSCSQDNDNDGAMMKQDTTTGAAMTAPTTMTDSTGAAMTSTPTSADSSAMGMSPAPTVDTKVNVHATANTDAGV